MNTLFLLLQAQGGGGSMLIWLILIFVVMWLLMVRPQQKQAKKVHEVADHTIDVEISNGVIVTVEKSMVQPIPEQPAQKK